MAVNVRIFGGEIGKEVWSILRSQRLDSDTFFHQSSEDYIFLHSKQHRESYFVFQSGETVVKRMKNMGLRTLSCGFSAYDTLVLSSSEMEQVVVSLQRKIHTISNRLIEPADYLVHTSRQYSDRAVLFSVAVLLLLDRGQPIFEFP